MFFIIRLCYEFFKIGAISFGGGLATLPHIYNLSRKTGWFTELDVTNILTVSQITPGPLACNVATYVGFRLEGFLPAFLATVSFMIPAIIFMGVVYKTLDRFQSSKIIKFIFKCIRAYSVGVILMSSINIFKSTFLKDKTVIGFYNILSNIDFRCVALGIVIYALKKKYDLKVGSMMAIAAVVGVAFKL